MAAFGDLPQAWISADPGAERQQSVAHALAALADWADDARVLVHDAARPGVTAEVIDRLLAALDDAEAAIPTLPVPDTLVEQAANMAGEVVDRSALARVQTPQAFHLGTLRRAHAEAVEAAASDDAQLVRRLGVPVATVAGDARLHKLTYAEDMAILGGLLGIGNMMRTAVGMGYDVHRLLVGKPLWIGGIEIAHSHGLEGHSDADVGLHALTDAILGALGDGDIGDHFPPSDPQWRGAASHRFLSFAAERVSARGGRIGHVDLTIIAEAPKIGPHRDAMRARIAEILAIPLERVSVKATTTERLGFTGRREGIASQAVATVQLPEN
jgi:2-C-methyl-D-erythritol 4-phosphate cytidylyltransferase/2-C-methyl-D-erythritol 2,4-cyclodiphosphate synthase